MGSRTRIAPQLVSALGHQMRKDILEALEAGPLSVGALADKLSIHRHTAGRHVKELRRVGLIQSSNTAAGRVMYSAVPIPERATDVQWARIPRLTRQRAVAAALARMQTATTSALVAGGFDRDTIHLSRTRLRINKSAWGELSQRYMEWLEYIEALQQEASESDEPTIDATAILMLFESTPSGYESPSEHVDPPSPTEEDAEDGALYATESLMHMVVNAGENWPAIVRRANELRSLGEAALAAQQLRG